MTSPSIAPARSTRPWFRICALVLVLACIGWQPAAAQGGALVTIAPDAEIRVTPLPYFGPRMTGRFVSLSPDTLVITTGMPRMTLAMPAAAVQRLEVRGPRQRMRGAVVGAGILGGIAVTFGGVDVAKGSLGTAEYLGTIAGNAVIGALVGAALAPHGWIAVR